MEGRLKRHFVVGRGNQIRRVDHQCLWVIAYDCGNAYIQAALLTTQPKTLSKWLSPSHLEGHSTQAPFRVRDAQPGDANGDWALKPYKSLAELEISDIATLMLRWFVEVGEADLRIGRGKEDLGKQYNATANGQAPSEPDLTDWQGLLGPEVLRLVADLQAGEDIPDLVLSRIEIAVPGVDPNVVISKILVSL